ncbi:MAG: Gfo/Idh/MocA family oxidoreductase [Anaerolineae bacterium]|nr:Gfo/Idh/MocA family oxidoreductase [Anaerolineae bacterium]
MGKLRLGFIGTGLMGKGHIQVVQVGFSDVAHVAAVCDTDADELAAAGALAPGAARYVDYRRMLTEEALDGVFIATPNHLHAQMILAALARGLHVFAEKPVATTIEACRRVLDAASQARSVVMIGCELRYAEYMQTIRGIVASGQIGAPHLVWCKEFRGPFLPKIDNWIQDQRRSGGALVDKNCHHFDLMRWWVDAAPTRVFATGSRSVVQVTGDAHEVIDHAAVTVEFENGARGNLLLSLFAPTGTEDALEFGILGDRGMLKTRLQTHEILVWQRETAAEIETVHRIRHLRKEANNLTVFRVPPLQVDAAVHIGFVEEHAGFFRAVLSGQPLLTTVEAVVDGTVIAIAAEASIRDGAPVEVGQWRTR